MERRIETGRSEVAIIGRRPTSELKSGVTAEISDGAVFARIVSLVVTVAGVWSGNFALINLGNLARRRWCARIDARYEGKWELPVIGAVPAPSAVLVRPDGYVAWVSDGKSTSPNETITHWFG